MVLKLSVVWTLSVVLSIIVTVLHVFKYKNDDDFLLVTYTIIQNIPIQVHKHLEQWAANADVPGEQSGVRCLAQGSHLSRGIEGGENARYWLPPPTIPAGAEIRTRNLGYKSYTLSIRPRLPPNAIKSCALTCFFTWVLLNALIYVSESLWKHPCAVLVVTDYM